MPFKEAQSGYEARAAQIKRRLTKARTEREQVNCLRAGLAFHLEAPKQRGYRSFLLINANLIYRLLLSGSERAAVRGEVERLASASARYGIPAVDCHLNFAHRPSGR